MKFPAFEYAAPTSVAEAVALLAAGKGGAKALAGGQSLLPTMAFRLARPSMLVDLRKLGELTRVTLGADGARLGARVRWRDIEDNAALAVAQPLLAAAVEHVAHYQIRNRGTIGGSLALADPAAELPACAVALDAALVLAGRAGERRVAARDFFKGLFETDLGPGELIVAVEVPPRPAGERTAFHELARRHGDYAIVGLAACATVGRGHIDAARLVYFGAGTRPVVAGGASAALTGTAGDVAALTRARAALADELDPPADLNASPAMRRHLAQVLLGRAVGDLLAA